METNYASVLKEVAAKKALDDTIKANVKAAVDAFKDRFLATVAAAAD
jgi:hypothetical protein